VRASVLWQLRSLGYTVSEAQNGDEALALMAAGSVDAIVSDIVMPGRHSGLALLEEAARRWPKVGTVLMSGYTENSVIQAGRLPDHVRLLIKPFTKLALARVVRQAIDA
jgi:CheY-like chemotaxis protein